MFYTILLSSIDETAENLKEGLDVMAKLACENADLVNSKTFPAIVCRMATEEECEFYQEIAKKYKLTLSIREVNYGDSVFENFDVELKQKEQVDLHLQDKATIISKLTRGLEILKIKKASVETFEEASENIVSYIRERKENIVEKFFPKSIFSTFIVWIFLAFLLCISGQYSWDDKIFFASLIFCGMMGFAVIYDFVSFKKKKKFYNSNAFYEDLINKISIQNGIKNYAIKDVEDVIDSLEVRNCLTLLQSKQRDYENVENYLKELNSSKSIDEIFMLH